jgi:hypothetical protein
MRTLTELQQAFAAYLFAADDVESALVESLEPGTRAEASEARLAIYRNNVIARLIDALADTYPAVERLVGEKLFRYAARNYIGDHPPRSPVLHEYGKSFPDFLRDFAPADFVPYLPDVARLERLYVDAYHATEAPPLPAPSVAERMAGGHDFRLALHPSARLMTSPYPVSRIWEVNRRDARIEKLKIPGDAEYLLVIRPSATVEVRRISAGAFAVLRALADGQTVRSALVVAARAAPGESLEGNLLELAAADTFSSTAEIV